jgi:phosphoglycerate kinase
MVVVAQQLSKILHKKVAIALDCIGPEAEKSIKSLQDGDVLLLENLRFHSAEEANSPVFARALARLAEIYVNDAFGTAHRNHASIVGITRYLPAVAGLLLEKELKALGGILKNPKHPFCTLLGGAKVSDKVGMIQNIIDKVDCLLIGGGMAATFLKAKSYRVGLSLIEEDRIDTASQLIVKAEKNGIHLVLPVDVIVADNASGAAKGRAVSVDKIPPKKMIVDIGPQTIKNFSKELRRCKTVFWNGPMGIYEIPQFSEGTRAMAKALANMKATTIIGGGSTAEIVTELGLAKKMTFVSTGGGATLAFLGGQKLPGVEALLDKD